MSEKPILFSGEMVRAILAGRKTQTRRTVKKQPITGDVKPTKDNGIWSSQTDRSVVSYFACPYGQPGDRLWIKETFRLSESNDCACYEPCGCKVGVPIYRATANMEREEKTDPPWKPSIFMPRKYSRITLEIEAVRADRLQSITDADAIAEGCCGVSSTQFGVPNFRYVWESINGHESWKANPWVWVVTFKEVFNEKLTNRPSK